MSGGSPRSRKHSVDPYHNSIGQPVAHAEARRPTRSSLPTGASVRFDRGKEAQSPVSMFGGDEEEWANDPDPNDEDGTMTEHADGHGIQQNPDRPKWFRDFHNKMQNEPENWRPLTLVVVPDVYLDPCCYENFLTLPEELGGDVTVRIVCLETYVPRRPKPKTSSNDYGEADGGSGDTETCKESPEPQPKRARNSPETISVISTSELDYLRQSMPKTYDDDIAGVRRILQRELDSLGRDVIIIGHGYGVLVASSACIGLVRNKGSRKGSLFSERPASVQGIVSLAGWLLGEGQSVFGTGPWEGTQLRLFHTKFHCFSGRSEAGIISINPSGCERLVDLPREATSYDPYIGHSWDGQFKATPRYLPWRQLAGTWHIVFSGDQVYGSSISDHTRAQWEKAGIVVGRVCKVRVRCGYNGEGAGGINGLGGHHTPFMTNWETKLRPLFLDPDGPIWWIRREYETKTGLWYQERPKANEALDQVEDGVDHADLTSAQDESYNDSTVVVPDDGDTYHNDELECHDVLDFNLDAGKAYCDDDALDEVL